MAMEKEVLVAYASTCGATKEIAEVVADALKHQGLNVDLQPMRDVRKLDEYSAVILGASLYMFRWHREMIRFLSRHQRDLKNGFPVALFSSGPSFTGDEQEWKEVRSQVERELAKYPWLKPVSSEIFGGKFDPANLKFPYNLIPAMKGIPAADLRDWDAIRTWAERIPSLLLQVPQSV